MNDLADLVPFREGCPILVKASEPPRPVEAEPFPPYRQSASQKAFYESLTLDFRHQFILMMMPRGVARARTPAFADFLERLYDVWLEFTAAELEEWT